MSRFSDLAKPPISPEEAQAADTSICPAHGVKFLAGWSKDGRVFFCPVGRQYWRVSRETDGMNAPLAYPKFGGV